MFTCQFMIIFLNIFLRVWNVNIIIIFQRFEIVIDESKIVEELNSWICYKSRPHRSLEVKRKQAKFSSAAREFITATNLSIRIQFSRYTRPRAISYVFRISYVSSTFTSAAFFPLFTVRYLSVKKWYTDPPWLRWIETPIFLPLFVIEWLAKFFACLSYITRLCR